MTRTRRGPRGAKAALVVVTLVTVAYANFDRPDAGNTGAPGDLGTCVRCHLGTLNGGPGRVRIEGVPDQYEPGETITLTVRVQHEGRRRWGFQLTALDANNRGVGTLAPGDPAFTAVYNGPGNLSSRQYAAHRTAGTFEGQRDEASWTVLWTAPDADRGLVTFYATGNAANGNNLNTGDSIYSTSATSGTATPAVVAPKYKKGKILLQANGSNLIAGATLEVSRDAQEPEIFPLALNKAGSKWVVKKKARSTPGELRVDDLLLPGTTVTLVARNPDGTASAPVDLSR